MTIFERAPIYGCNAGGRAISKRANFLMRGAIGGGMGVCGRGEFGAKKKIPAVSAACARFR